MKLNSIQLMFQFSKEYGWVSTKKLHAYMFMQQVDWDSEDHFFIFHQGKNVLWNQNFHKHVPHNNNKTHLKASYLTYCSDFAKVSVIHGIVFAESKSKSVNLSVSSIRVQDAIHRRSLLQSYQQYHHNYFIYFAQGDVFFSSTSFSSKRNKP